MKVKVIEAFNDRTVDHKKRTVGEVIEVDAERASKLEGLGVVKRIIEAVNMTKHDKS